MADLNPGPGSREGRRSERSSDPDRSGWTGVDPRRDRAQLVLIGGLILAFTVVALTLVVNSVLYTDNVESRATLPVAENAEEFTATLEESISQAIREENRREWNSPSAQVVEDEVETDVGIVAELVTDRELKEHGALTAVDLGGDPTETGRRVGQPSSGTFEGSSDDDWTVVTNTDGVRNVTFSVDLTSLPQNPPDPQDLDDSGDGAFHVDVAGPADTWTAFLYRDASNYLVLDVDGGPTCRSPTTNGPAEVDLTEGVIRSPDGSGTMQTATCNYRFADGVGDPYVVRFANGAEATGSFDMVIDDDATTAVDCSPGSIRCENAVYSVSVGVTYDTETFSFETTLRVAPGEPRTVAP